jgi:hypothetical protein
MREISIPLQVKEPPALFSCKIKELVQIIKGDGLDGGDSDDDESDDNGYQSSDGHEYGITTLEGNTVGEKSPFTAKFAGISPIFLLQHDRSKFKSMNVISIKWASKVVGILSLHQIPSPIS